MRTFSYRDAFSPGEFDVVWASPPCTTFSCARRTNLGRYVRGELCTVETLARDTREEGVPILRRTEEILAYLAPKRWFMENPYTGTMKDYVSSEPAVFDYCMFGYPYRKRTAVWSNVALASVRCDGSHLVDGRRHAMTCIGASRTLSGQGGGQSKRERYSIPRDLVVHLVSSGLEDIPGTPL